jgi:hypothetical protein
MIINRATDQQKKAISNLKMGATVQFLEFLEVLEREATSLLLSAETPVQVHRMQGRISLLRDLISAPDDADKALGDH